MEENNYFLFHLFSIDGSNKSVIGITTLTKQNITSTKGEPDYSWERKFKEKEK